MRTHGRNHWIKLYVEMLHDPKIGLLTDDLKWRFTSVLLLAGEIDEGGFLPELSDMAWQLHTVPETLAGQMRTLAGRGLVELRVHPDGDERWFVTKFAERQAPSTNAERQKQWRKRNATNATVTKRYAKVTPETETETETEGNAPEVSEAAGQPTDLPEFLSPSQITTIVEERQNSSDPVVILEDYIAGRIPGKPDSRKPDYDRDWRMPILQMVTLVNGDTALAKVLIDAALEEARKPKAKDGKRYRIVRPHGLLPFFQTQIDNHRATSATADDDTIWQRALHAISRKDYSDDRLKAAIRAIGGSGRIASANGHDTEQLRRQLASEYRRIPTPA